MHSKSDAQLLREYAEHGTELAFTEIVERHANLVYSAAVRQVDSPDKAPDITQRVLVGLAQGARTLSPRLAENASLAGWLCRSARNLSLNLRRDEFRQLSRERQAMEHLNQLSEFAPDWEQLRLVLDEAMSELSESDYDALVMRFLKNQDLRSVGQALGVTDDTAQKRVSRALDKLREHLVRRGIRSPATALSAVLAANAVQAAPVGLTVTISIAAAQIKPAIPALTVIPSTKAIAMSTLQKTLITAVIAVAMGVVIYQARQTSSLRTQIQALEQQAPLAVQIEQLTSERDDAARQIVALRDENESLSRNRAELLRLRNQVSQLRSELKKLTESMPNSSLAPSASDEPLWKRQAAQLEHYFELNPDEKIPEFQFLTNNESFYSLAVKVAGFDESNPGP